MSKISNLWNFLFQALRGLELFLLKPPNFGTCSPNPAEEKIAVLRTATAPRSSPGKSRVPRKKNLPPRSQRTQRGLMGNRYWLIVSTARSQRSVVGGRGELLGSSLFFVVLRYADQTSAATSRLLPDKFFQQRATINRQPSVAARLIRAFLADITSATASRVPRDKPQLQRGRP